MSGVDEERFCTPGKERESYSRIGPEMLLIASLPPIDVN